MSKEIASAFNVIKQAMIDDDPSKPGSYAHTWHCNLAMSFYDAMDDNCIDEHVKHVWADDGASRFMKLCFDVETKG
jgi:hypothetical protein